MIDRLPPPKPAVEVSAKSPLEEALGARAKKDRVYKKYNLKRPKDYRAPSPIWEGEDRS